MSLDPWMCEQWEKNIIPIISDLIKIPYLSPDYDEECLTNGLQEKCFAMVVDWIEKNKPIGAKVTLYEEKGKRTPFLHVDIPAFKCDVKESVLMYSHQDRQPHFGEWSSVKVAATKEGEPEQEVKLGPCKPIILDMPFGHPPQLRRRLTGRGGADDIYGAFASIMSILDLQRQGRSHGPIHIIVEGAEESNSDDLEYWIQLHKAKFGKVSLILVLDSGAANYDQLWMTDALRGVGSVVLQVDTCKDSIHSGLGGGCVPDPVRIIRHLLDRLEDSLTGRLKVKSLNVDIPDSVVKNLAPFAEVSEKQFFSQFTFLDGVKPNTMDQVQLMLDTTWRPSMTVTGFDGAPSTSSGGNVLRGSSAVKLSFRLPPGVNVEAAEKEINEILKANPPNGAKITVKGEPFCAGWCAPKVEDWLQKAFDSSSMKFFGKPSAAHGCGGSIPFVELLNVMFKNNNPQFCITGVLGPGSNAHGIDESLDIEFAKGINSCVTDIVEAHSKKQM